MIEPVDELLNFAANLCTTRTLAEWRPVPRPAILEKFVTTGVVEVPLKNSGSES